jgi:hypothetical protein
MTMMKLWQQMFCKSFCESELPIPDPADEAALYPPVAAWEPVRRSLRRQQAHRVSLGYSAMQAEIPEFRRAHTSTQKSPGAQATNLVAQSAFLRPYTSAQVVTQCTMSPRVQFLGVSMQKSDFSSAHTNTHSSLRTTSFAGASVNTWSAHPTFQHSASPLLTAERLNGYGARWLQSLPVTVRPLITAKRHPHIVNKFAILWGDEGAVNAYFDDLLISTRPDRRGFAMEVLDELVELQRAVQDQRRF